MDVADRVVTFRDPEADCELADPFTSTRIVKSVGGARQARRFEMAQAADAIVSIAGRVGAREAVMLGLALSRPALPCHSLEQRRNACGRVIGRSTSDG